ncbi:MAG: ferredoxin family protein [Deltaproteobacteria bacterium]|nr:ferredoxin family protein [Deltaproteobacteria bacterium]
MYPVIKEEKCQRCGTCIEVCPSDVFAATDDLPAVAAPEECIECGACVDNCPAAAVYLDD